MGWGSVVGAAIGAGASLFGQKKANEASAASTAAQMAFQDNLSRTAHQREVDDLRAAGLNPTLSAGGSGASVPGGSSYQAQNELASGKEVAMAAAQLDNIKAQTEATKAQAVKTGQDTRLSAAEADKAEILKAPYAVLNKGMGSIKSTATSMKNFYTGDHPLSPKSIYRSVMDDSLYNDLKSKFTNSAASVKAMPPRLPLPDYDAIARDLKRRKGDGIKIRFGE